MLADRAARYSKIIEENGLAFEGDQLEALRSQPGYVFTLDLSAEALALIESTPDLKLIRETPKGRGRWYASN